MTIFIIILLLLGVIIWQIYPAINAPHISEFTNNIQEKPIEEKTKETIEEITIESPTITTSDFIPIKNTTIKNTIKINEHVKSIINKDSKKSNKQDSWNPGYYKYKDFKEIFIPYEKKWFCNTNKIIHGNEKEFLNCKDCNKQN